MRVSSLVTVRYDSPVQNTRRFLEDDVTIANTQMHRGDTVLLLLAAANRDGTVNPQPHRFDTSRKNRRTFSFGSGVHACPGKAIVVAMATAAVRYLLATGLDVARASARMTYYPSANARIPLFDSTERLS
ncbi:MAG: cytochrome P450 [Vulcanimicrobiaceae bacterium]